MSASCEFIHVSALKSFWNQKFPEDLVECWSRSSLNKVFDFQKKNHIMIILEVALASFWQFARHWRQEESSKLELSCKDGNIQLYLSAKLGHPDSIHFPDSGPIPSPNIKKKSPSQQRRQERRSKEAAKKAS